MSYLLTKQEQEELYCKYVDADDDVYVKAIAKAQDRKSRRLMLEDIKKACINPNHKAFRCPKYACCECMDELKEELK